jgi:hypothetical protein
MRDALLDTVVDESTSNLRAATYPYYSNVERYTLRLHMSIRIN